MAKKLTPKQEKFCLAYIQTGNASEAYRQAYDAGKMSEKVIHNKASDLLKRGDIGVRLEELRERACKVFDVTIEEKKKWLKLTVDMGLKTKTDAWGNKVAHNLAAAVSAVAELNRMDGDHAPIRGELTGKDGGPIVIDDMARLKAMSPEERKARIEELIGKRDAA